MNAASFPSDYFYSNFWGTSSYFSFLLFGSFGLRCLTTIDCETTAEKLTLSSWFWAYSFYYFCFSSFKAPLLINFASLPSLLLVEPFLFDEDFSPIDLLLFDLLLIALFLIGLDAVSLVSKSASSMYCAPLFFLKLVLIILSYSCNYAFFYFFSKLRILYWVSWCA